MEKLKYEDRDSIYEVSHKIETLNKTRNNKIKQSQRLEKYNELWKLIMFILNIEAVIFVILSISAKSNSLFNNDLFIIISSIFAIYVILVQYYIGVQGYAERALKAHYTQLHIEDLILSLKNLLILNNIDNNKINEYYLLKEFVRLINEYQTILKNNENHSPIDYEMCKKEKLDFTKDNIMIYSNILFCFLLPIIMAVILHKFN